MNIFLRTFHLGVQTIRNESKRMTGMELSIWKTNVSRVAIGLLLLAAVGCAPEAHFTLNSVYLVKQERDTKQTLAQRKSELGDVLIAMFGTPDNPMVPELDGMDVKSVLDSYRIGNSAGPVFSDESGRSYGLYREHCAHCHGITGDGAGPTAAFLNPYPRDYRSGVFKFKSTPKGQRPTHEDLRRIVLNGIPGTAMPSFKVLPENEVESLIHYVRYLSVRGEVERMLMSYAATELDEKTPFVRYQGAEAERAADVDVLKSFAGEVIQKWIDADGLATEVAAPSHQLSQDAVIARGRELFYGTIANCVKCHGDSALGDGLTTDYDDWTKEIEPANHTALEQFLDAGALPPRTITPRNLRLGVYRGGRRPIDLFWRIRNGIDGTPMPGATMKAEDAGAEVKGLNTNDIWCLIEYVQSLPYETISKPAMPEAAVERSRL
jgi:mono/diheme cytochrome c family protein